MSKATLHLDLHPLAKNSVATREALDDLFTEALAKRVKAAEIIPGKGSGQLMVVVKRYLEQKSVKQHYKRYEVDPKNHGRLFVHFR